MRLVEFIVHNLVLQSANIKLNNECDKNSLVAGAIVADKFESWFVCFGNRIQNP